MVRGRGGFTLTELTVVFSMLLSLLVLMAMYFMKAQHYISDIDAYSTLQRETNVTLQRVCMQLGRSTTRFLHFSNQIQPTDLPSYAYCLSPSSDDPEGPVVEFGGAHHQVIWKKWVGFFHDPTNQELQAAEIPLTSPTFLLLTKPSPDVTYSSLIAAPRPKVIGRRIVEFSVERFERRIVVSLIGRGLSPVPLRSESDKLLEIRANGQVSLIE